MLKLTLEESQSINLKFFPTMAPIPIFNVVLCGRKHILCFHWERREDSVVQERSGSSQDAVVTHCWDHALFYFLALHSRCAICS